MGINIQDVIKEAIVAVPCPAKWSEMVGDDKVRLCAQCNLNVHNTRMMTDEEVLQLVLDAASGKRVCGKLYRRSDGTLLTQNCPVGLARFHQRAKQAASWIAGVLAVLISSAVQAAPGKQCDQKAKKPVFHGTVRAETPGVTRVNNKPAAVAAPPLTEVSVGGSFDGQMVVVPNGQMIAATKKSLSDTETKHGKESLAAAYEHQRLGQLLETAYPQEAPNLQSAEEQFERAYQISKAHGDKQAAKAIALAHLANGMIKDTAIRSRWEARTKD